MVTGYNYTCKIQQGSKLTAGGIFGLHFIDEGIFLQQVIVQLSEFLPDEEHKAPMSKNVFIQYFKLSTTGLNDKDTWILFKISVMLSWFSKT